MPAWGDEPPAGIVGHPQSVDNSGHEVRDFAGPRKPTWSHRRGVRRGDPGAWNRRSRRGVGSHALNAGVVARSACEWELAGSCCVMLAIGRCHHLPGTGSIDRDRLEDPAALNVDALLGGRYGPVGFYTAKQIPKASQRRLPPGPVISACETGISATNRVPDVAATASASTRAKPQRASNEPAGRPDQPWSRRAQASQLLTGIRLGAHAASRSRSIAPGLAHASAASG